MSETFLISRRNQRYPYRHSDMTKQIVAFWNIVKAPKKRKLDNVYITYQKCKYKTTNWIRGNNYKRDQTEPAHMLRPCSKNGRRMTAQNSIEMDTKTKESTRKTEEKLDGRNKEGHEWKKPKWRPVGRQEAMESRCRIM